MADSSRIFQVQGTCNNYPWGKRGRDSLAARLCDKTANDDFHIQDDQFYSELWFGDYPTFPTTALPSGKPLHEILGQHQQALLGTKVVEQYDAQLPYLPKILSIAKALPVQIHPNKKLAEKLHKDNPDKFTDSNHKPEIAIALSRFEVFAGWRLLSDISPLFDIPSLKKFVPSETTDWSDKTLRKILHGFLTADHVDLVKIESDISGLSTVRLEGLGLGQLAYIPQLLPRLQEQYGKGDPGTLITLLCMNYMVLEAGDAVFIPADCIHAYLSGDIVECMARSNNVLNCGFHPAEERDDANLFVDTLTFDTRSKDDNVRLPSVKSESGRNGHTTAYQPPLREFDALRIQLKSGQDEDLVASEGPSMAIVTKGGGKLRGNEEQFAVEEGHIFFIAPGQRVTWTVSSNLEVFQIVL